MSSNLSRRSLLVTLMGGVVALHPSGSGILGGGIAAAEDGGRSDRGGGSNGRGRGSGHGRGNGEDGNDRDGDRNDDPDAQESRNRDIKERSRRTVAELHGDSIEVVYPDGWRESLKEGRLRLRDPDGRLVVDRAATAEDRRRIRAYLQ